MRRITVSLAFALGLLAAPATAGPGHERVSIHPHVGDVNTTFVYRGSGWRPNAQLGLSHGALCGTGPCPALIYLRFFRSDDDGRFRITEHPADSTREDYAGYTICFGYAPRRQPAFRCRASGRITVVPPSASASPADDQRQAGGGVSPTVTLAARHFKAGTRLTIRIRYPDGRTRVLHATARRHGAHVGEAYAPRGGAIRYFTPRASDPDGTYRVRVTDAGNGDARTEFQLETSP